MTSYNKPLLMPCASACGCEYCSEKIKRKELFLVIYKKGYRQVGTSRVNICGMCLEKAYRQVPKCLLKKLKIRETEKKL